MTETPILPLLKVAYLCEFPTLLGGEKSLLTFLSQWINNKGHAVVVAPCKGSLADQLSDLDVMHVPWPKQGKLAAEQLIETLQRQQVQLVHSNSLMMADTAFLLAERMQIPCVAHVRDIMSLSQSHRTRLSQVDKLIAVSEAVRESLLEQGIPQAQVTTIYNAVDAERLRQSARPGLLRQELKLLSEVPLVGCVGQIAIRKGQDFFLEVAEGIARIDRSVHFVMVGERYSTKQESRDYEQLLHRKAAQYPLTSRVHFMGYRSDVPSILSDLDVLVVPSRQEPLSRTALEGFAMGVYVVATDVGGTSEILRLHPDLGRLVLSHDVSACTNTILGAITQKVSKAPRLALSQSGLSPVFLPERQFHSMLRLYEQVLLRRAQGR